MKAPSEEIQPERTASTTLASSSSPRTGAATGMRGGTTGISIVRRARSPFLDTCRAATVGSVDASRAPHADPPPARRAPDAGPLSAVDHAPRPRVGARAPHRRSALPALLARGPV